MGSSYHNMNKNNKLAIVEETVTIRAHFPSINKLLRHSEKEQLSLRANQDPQDGHTLFLFCSVLRL